MVLPDHLPLTGRLEGVFAARLPELAEPTRTLLLVAAADGTGALSEVLADQPDRSIWHRAAATLGTNEGVAAELEAAATRTRRRGVTIVAVSALERAAELGARSPERAHGDVDLALDILWLVASRSWWKDPGPDARRDIVTALDRIESAEGDPRVLSSLGYAAAERRVRAVINGLLRARSVEELDPETTRLLGTAAIVTGAWHLAPGLLAASAAGLRTQGRLGQLPRVLVVQAMVAVRRADWNVALPASDEARRLATGTRQTIWVGGADAVARMAAAMRGEEDRAERLAADAERVVSPLGVTFVLAAVQMARGAAALGAGRHLDAFEQLRRLFTAHDPAYHWTMRWWALADLVEAAVRTHHRELVEPLVAEFESLAEHTPAFWLHTVLRHARALLAEDREAEARTGKQRHCSRMHCPLTCSGGLFNAAGSCSATASGFVADEGLPSLAHRCVPPEKRSTPWGHGAEARDHLTLPAA